MKFEPPIDRAALTQTLVTAYGLADPELAFVPVGYAAACYVIRCRDGQRLFVKLWPERSVGGGGIAALEATLRLLTTIHDRVYPWVPFPIPTIDGASWSTFAGWPLALFPFLPGETAPPWATLPVQNRDELARVLATIHRATPELAAVLPARDRFEIADEATLIASLAAVDRIGPGARPGLRTLRDRVRQSEPEIRDQLDRLHRVQSRERRLAGPVVLCHTDLGGDNLLIDGNRLYLLDWDEAAVAPPEHDLCLAVDDGFARFLEVYRGAGGIGPWHVDHFAFYLLRRYLGDLTVRFARLLSSSTSDEEDADLLTGMDRWGFDQWRRHDRVLELVARALG
jgi:aminoglycoside phosphotransferase (APT) family kinase protein